MCLKFLFSVQVWRCHCWL